MNTFFNIYLASWITLCTIACFLYIRSWNDIAISRKTYWLFLFRPWKLATFFSAAICLIIVAPYSGDPTWDYFDAFFMSVLTYLTAPWSIGALYKAVKKELPLKQAYVAFCIWMFSASWSYDLYILVKDGAYPITWYSNIYASSILYILAGLFWNLDWIKNKGVIFSFMEKDWPVPSSDFVFARILWFALPIMVIVTVLFIYVFF